MIAFNILNIGRAKLAAAALGASKKVSTASIQYANQREQFKTPIAKFGAISYKLAEQAIRIYALESVLYRIGEMIDLKEKELQASGMNMEASLLGAADEYAIECAMLKVFGSEVLDYVVDEGVQVLGGYGFSADYPMDRAYRDSRINRIFEGTNEINRLLSVDMIMKRAMKGTIDLFGPAKAIQAELTSIPDFSDDENVLFAAERKIVRNLKKVILMTAGSAAQKYMTALAKEQEIIMNIADMMIEVFTCESLLLRAEKLVSMRGEKESALQLDILRVSINDAVDRIQISARNIIASMSDGDEQRMLLSGLKRFTKWAPVNTKDARRRISSALCEANAYCF